MRHNETVIPTRSRAGLSVSLQLYQPLTIALRRLSVMNAPTY